MIMIRCKRYLLFWVCNTSLFVAELLQGMWVSVERRMTSKLLSLFVVCSRVVVQLLQRNYQGTLMARNYM